MKHLQCLVGDTSVLYRLTKALRTVLAVLFVQIWGASECPVTEKGSLRHWYLR